MEKSSCLLKNLSLIFYLTCYFTKQRGSKKGVGVNFTQRGDLRPGVIEAKGGGWLTDGETGSTITLMKHYSIVIVIVQLPLLSLQCLGPSFNSPLNLYLPNTYPISTYYCLIIKAGLAQCPIP